MQNNKADFLERISAHKLIIYKICNAYCKNRYDRDDLAQEMIYQIWRSWGTFDPKYKFTTWMYRIALNVAISFYRKDRKRKESHAPLSEHLIDIVEENESPAIAANIQLLTQFINELKELDKALMILYLEENNYREISEILGISETNVATRISRIKEKLKQRFKNIKN